jgi:hypothetical protein
VLLSNKLNSAGGDARDEEPTRGREALEVRMEATGKAEEARGREDNDEKEVDDSEPTLRERGTSLKSGCRQSITSRARTQASATNYQKSSIMTYLVNELGH